MFWAAQNGHAGCIDALVAAGSDVNKAAFNGSTPLMWAVGHVKCAERLLRCGADTGVTSSDGRTARQWAEDDNHPEVVALLDRWDGGAAVAPDAATAAAMEELIERVAAVAAEHAALGRTDDTEDTTTPSSWRDFVQGVQGVQQQPAAAGPSDDANATAVHGDSATTDRSALNTAQAQLEQAMNRAEQPNPEEGYEPGDNGARDGELQSLY